ncbi:phosphatase PAP2 family protein, partial [Nitrospirota bacterium]
SSGHSSAAFSVMTVFAHQYRDTKWVPYAAYGTAALTALSRVHDDKHWASDVLFGGAVGIFSARSVLDVHGEGSNKNVSITPIILSGRPGLMASYIF